MMAAKKTQARKPKSANVMSERTSTKQYTLTQFPPYRRGIIFAHYDGKRLPPTCDRLGSGIIASHCHLYAGTKQQ